MELSSDYAKRFPRETRLRPREAWKNPSRALFRLGLVVPIHAFLLLTLGGFRCRGLLPAADLVPDLEGAADRTLSEVAGRNFKGFTPLQNL